MTQVTRSNAALGAINRRARATNRRLFGDDRSVSARRMKELATAFAARYGGLDALNEPARQVATRAATLAFQCEVVEGSAKRGERINGTKFTTMSNALARMLARLEWLQTPRPLPPGTTRTIADLTETAA